MSARPSARVTLGPPASSTATTAASCTRSAGYPQRAHRSPDRACQHLRQAPGAEQARACMDACLCAAGNLGLLAIWHTESRQRQVCKPGEKGEKLQVWPRGSHLQSSARCACSSPRSAATRQWPGPRCQGAPAPCVSCASSTATKRRRRLCCSLTWQQTHRPGSAFKHGSLPTLPLEGQGKQEGHRHCENNSPDAAIGATSVGRLVKSQRIAEGKPDEEWG